MPNTTEADEILQHARPLIHQRGHETQPYGHLAQLPIALEESACRKSVDNLNQLLADTITIRDLYKKGRSFRDRPKAASPCRSRSRVFYSRTKSY
jgi:hypothetical protein